MPLPIAKLGSPEYSIRLAGIRARHSNARPKPAVNPAWANSENDTGELLVLHHTLWMSHERLLEALKNKMGHKTCGHEFDCVCADDMARAAIAKATGEA